MKGKKTFRISLLLLASISFLALLQIRCRHDGINVANLDKVCFQRDVLPIFQNSCGTTNCHGSRGRGGYSFTDYTSIMKAISPSNPYKSKAYLAMTGKAFTQLMPPSGALSQNDRILVRVWIEQGAANTTCTTAVVTDPVVQNPAKSSNIVCFQRDLLPVLVSSCGITGCHDATTHKSGYTVTSYASVMTNLVQAGSPSTSKLYSVITKSQSSENAMPPKPYASLSSAVKDSIFNWIKNGALNETCSTACDTTGVVTYNKQISALISTNCIACHSATNASKGIQLDTYANVKVQLDNGKLLAAVKGTSIQMPPGYRISNCELRQIELWKANGATQN